MARIIFDASINTRPFKQYLSAMTNAANAFFKEIKGKAEALSEKIGSIGENFYLPIEPEIFKIESLASSISEIECEIKNMNNAIKASPLKEFAEKIDIAEGNSKTLFDVFKNGYSHLSSFIENSRNLSKGLESINNNIKILKNPKKLFTGIISESKKAVKALASAFKFLLSPKKMLTAAQNAFNISKKLFNKLTAKNPIGLIITAVTALIAGIGLLVSNWDKVWEIADEFQSSDFNGASPAFGRLSQPPIKITGIKFVRCSIKRGANAIGGNHFGVNIREIQAPRIPTNRVIENAQSRVQNQGARINLFMDSRKVAEGIIDDLQAVAARRDVKVGGIW